MENIIDLSKFKSLSKLNFSNYLINENGDIYSLKSNKILSKTLDQDGYVCNGLYSDNKKRINTKGHRLVAEIFLDKIEGKNIVNHKDFNKTNNNYKNLEWCTQQHNIKHSYSNGRKSPMFGKKGKEGKKGINNIRSLKVICLNDNKIFDCIGEVAYYYNVDRGNVSKVCKGKYKHTKSYIFKYYNNNI